MRPATLGLRSTDQGDTWEDSISRVKRTDNLLVPSDDDDDDDADGDGFITEGPKVCIGNVHALSATVPEFSQQQKICEGKRTFMKASITAVTLVADNLATENYARTNETYASKTRQGGMKHTCPECKKFSSCYISMAEHCAKVRERGIEIKDFARRAGFGDDGAPKTNDSRSASPGQQSHPGRTLIGL